jgi:hypothetical protein
MRLIAIYAIALAAAGCGGGGDGDGSAPKPPDEEEARAVLDGRTEDYPLALRTASLKLLDTPPKLAQIKEIAGAPGPRVAYEAAIDGMLTAPRFRRRMVRWWKDTMRLGGAAADGRPSRDTAPLFAAQVLVEGRPYSEIFTASSGTCPDYNEADGAFSPKDCDNGVPVHAGVLTNPGAQHQFFGNMAFRRVRWVQEIFLCDAFPAERAPGSSQEGGYTSPWPLDSIASSPVNFRATDSVVCGSCHATMNHIAPLFGAFDASGALQASIQVQTPVTPAPLVTEISHWLSGSEVTAWRYGEPAADLPALGQAIASDPAAAECAVARVWNFAMSKEDIVTDEVTVPRPVIQPYIEQFQANGMNLREVLRSILVSDDFVRF